MPQKGVQRSRYELFRQRREFYEPIRKWFDVQWASIWIKPLIILFVALQIVLAIFLVLALPIILAVAGVNGWVSFLVFLIMLYFTIVTGIFWRRVVKRGY